MRICEINKCIRNMCLLDTYIFVCVLLVWVLVLCSCLCVCVCLYICRLVEDEGMSRESLVFGDDDYLVTKNTRQYLYRITPLSPIRAPEKVWHMNVH